MKNFASARFRPPKVPKPPRELAKKGRELWRTLQETYGIEDAGGLSLLLTVCRSEDDIHRMREQVAKDGDVIEDRFHQKLPHPLLASIRGTEQIKRQALAALHLDVEPARDGPGRPPGR